MKLLIPITLFALLLSSCSKPGTPTPVDIEWASLTDLHIQATGVVTSLTEELSPEDLQKMISEVQTSVRSVVEAGIPDQLPNAASIEQSLRELGDLAKGFEADPESMKAIEPLVSSMLTSAGLTVPHVCPSCGGHHAPGQHHVHHEHPPKEATGSVAAEPPVPAAE